MKPLELPKEFIIPQEHKTSNFLFRKLTVRDVYEDYLAVMSSIDTIRETRGGSWPNKDLTFEEDLIDLGWHQKEFENESSFAYTVFSPDNSKCLGCFYIYPAGFRKEISEEYDADVSFWVTKDSYEKGLYEILYKDIKEFLTKWPFKNPYWSNKLIPSIN